MDLLPLIEGRRFLGREFLTWLWFECELFGGELEGSGVGDLELVFEKNIVLAAGPKDSEQSRLKGPMPSATPEAREAVRQGKLPTQARARLTRGEQQFAFVFNADTLSLASLRLPAVLTDQADEPFFDRVALVEEIESYLDALFGDFLRLRSGAAWDELVMPAILRWVRGHEPADTDAYLAARRRALTTARGGPAKRHGPGPPPAETRPLRKAG